MKYYYAWLLTWINAVTSHPLHTLPRITQPHLAHPPSHYSDGAQKPIAPTLLPLTSSGKLYPPAVSSSTPSASSSSSSIPSYVWYGGLAAITTAAVGGGVMLWNQHQQNKVNTVSTSGGSAGGVGGNVMTNMLKVMSHADPRPEVAKNEAPATGEGVEDKKEEGKVVGWYDPVTQQVISTDPSLLERFQSVQPTDTLASTEQNV